MTEFDLLSDRQKYGSNRRASLLSKFLKEKGDKVEWMMSYEVDVEKLLKRKLGYAEWDKNWDVGLHLKDEKIYVLLSRKNDLGSFEILERVEYSEELDVGSWLLDCMVIHKVHLR
jgi:hypothetical protein